MENSNTKVESGILHQTTVYGPPPDETKNTTIKGTSIAITIILFILGVIALLNKKMSKKAKLVVIITLVAIAILIAIITVGIINF